MDVLRAAFSLTPEHILSTTEADRQRRQEPDGHRRSARPPVSFAEALDDPAIVRRAVDSRARSPNTSGSRRCSPSWVDAHPDFERLAPVPFSVVCFRWNPADRQLPPAELDAANERLLDLVNQTGDVFLSHTKLREGVALRLAIGHMDTTERHVKRAWDILIEHGRSL